MEVTLESLDDSIRTNKASSDLKFLQIDSKINDLATKDDVKEMIEVFKKFQLGVHVSGRIFNISGKLILYIGGLAAAVVAIVTLVKIAMTHTWP